MSQQTPSERTPKPKENEQRALPVLPVRDTVLFPHAVLPLTVGRESSVQLINSLGEDKTIIVVAQREARVDAPQAIFIPLVLPQSYIKSSRCRIKASSFLPKAWSEYV
jgi:ATP-dependent Lon protease